MIAPRRVTSTQCEMDRELVNLPLNMRHHKPNHPETTEPVMIKPISSRTILALLTLLIMTISGCATVDLGEHRAESAQQALAMAAEEDQPTVARDYLLRTASNFQDQGRHDQARTLLKSPQLGNLTPEQERQRRLLAMASAQSLDDKSWASELDQQLDTNSFLDYPDRLMTRAAQLQADIQALAGNRLAAARTLILLSQTDSSLGAQELHDQIWQHLQSLDASELEAASPRGFEDEGWLALAQAMQAPQANLDQQGRIVRRWQNRWPGHPAAQIPPTPLALLAELAGSRPENIVLALPFNGRLASAGEAIRDGFLAAYYADESADREKTDIRIIDTSDDSFRETYRELSDTSTDLIVGPLDKARLAELTDLETLPVPVLGLNYLNDDDKAPAGMHQFGLSAEDEARQIAQRLAEDDLRHILAVIPYGSWGDRVERAFRDELNEQELVLLDVQRFMEDENLRSVTADLLGITVSRDRAIDVERTIGRNVEFEPRRRQDAEAIVMVAAPTLARQFKPLFAFYYGGDLPVYSPSIIYEGTPEPSRDRDLNRVNFTDIPWVLAPESGLREQASEHFNNTRGQLGRLFAMGADAWQIAKRLPLLQRIDDASISGLTGKLTMDQEGSIHRAQQWAQFRDGKAVLLEEPDEAVDQTTAEQEPDTE